MKTNFKITENGKAQTRSFYQSNKLAEHAVLAVASVVCELGGIIASTVAGSAHECILKPDLIKNQATIRKLASEFQFCPAAAAKCNTIIELYNSHLEFIQPEDLTSSADALKEQIYAILESARKGHKPEFIAMSYELLKGCKDDLSTRERTQKRVMLFISALAHQLRKNGSKVMFIPFASVIAQGNMKKGIETLKKVIERGVIKEIFPRITCTFTDKGVRLHFTENDLTRLTYKYVLLRDKASNFTSHANFIVEKSIALIKQAKHGNSKGQVWFKPHLKAYTTGSADVFYRTAQQFIKRCEEEGHEGKREGKELFIRMNQEGTSKPSHEAKEEAKDSKFDSSVAVILDIYGDKLDKCLKDNKMLAKCIAKAMPADTRRCKSRAHSLRLIKVHYGDPRIQRRIEEYLIKVNLDVT